MGEGECRFLEFGREAEKGFARSGGRMKGLSGEECTCS